MISASNETERFENEKEYERWSAELKKYGGGVNIVLNQYDGIERAYETGNFITAYFPAERKAQFAVPQGVENITLNDSYRIDRDAGNILLKYMVHLKTQQAFARNEGEEGTAKKIQDWFDRFESALQTLLDDKSIHLEYDFRKYNFKIKQAGREPFSFNELSDGYSSVLYIVSDLILRMDKNWLMGEEISKYDGQGIVLIDELETHLHIELQKKILPFLTEFFPNLQFIVTTHSPYILNSISNARAYDLEKHIELDNLSAFSSDDLAEGYFEADAYSDELKELLKRYEELCFKQNINEEERAERAQLRTKFKNLSPELSRDAREKFKDIEQRMIRIERKNTPKAQLAIADLQKAYKSGGTYNTDNVNAALKEMFHGKCYICENKAITSYQIEHLIPHRENKELKYDWENLFWSCAHCNNIKLAKYEPILDCTKENVERLIAFRKKGYFGTDETLEFVSLVEDSEAVKNTVSLLKDAYYGTTPQKKIEARIIRKTLRKELAEFKEYVREYQEAEDEEEKEDAEILIRKELKDSSAFTAFKRWLIWDNEIYSELEKYIPEN